jgi:hypothetical protein
LEQAELGELQFDDFIDDLTICPQAVAILRKQDNNAAKEPL